jgi:hypothetical protein
MRNILTKEFRLSASILAYLFILFGFMFFLPGYPILCGAFFSALGLFQSFQFAREANDTVFSALLPIAKKDVVRGRYCFVCIIEICTILVMVIPTVLRMTVWADSVVYRSNALMNANLFALGAAFVIFGLFNWIFVGGFYKTAYKLGRPFVTFIIVGFVCIGIFEALHHIPGMEWLDSFGTDNLGRQFILLLAGIAVYIVTTVLSCRKACENFEKIDL